MTLDPITTIAVLFTVYIALTALLAAITIRRDDRARAEHDTTHNTTPHEYRPGRG